MGSNRALGKHFDRFVGEQVKSGRYGTEDEVLRAGLRLLEQREQMRLKKLAELDRLLAEGLAELDAGKGIPAEQVFAEVKAAIRKRAR
jgi:antitoxin ParD1/3/4